MTGGVEVACAEALGAELARRRRPPGVALKRRALIGSEGQSRLPQRNPMRG